MPDFSKMSPEDLEALTREMREGAAGVPVDKVDPVPAAVASPAPAPSQDPYDWSDLAGFDFTTPSGRMCFMRSLGVKDVAAAGILSQVSRLEALADKLVRQGNGQPPVPEQELTEDEVTSVANVLERIIPMAVIKPTILPLPPEGEEKVVGKVYVDSIPLQDQVAIVTRAIGDISKFDNFRK